MIEEGGKIQKTMMTPRKIHRLQKNREDVQRIKVCVLGGLGKSAGT